VSHTERAKYLTDLTDEQWQILRKLLPPRSRRGAPKRICRRGVLDAIIYVVRSGCPWRLLPHEFPNWKTVYGIFLRWRDDGTWQSIHDTLRDMLRHRAGRKKSRSAAIIDSQTVKTSEVGGQRGYDAGKKINGRKRHIIVDTLGLILALVVHPADVQDYDGAALGWRFSAGSRNGSTG
jgi:putative transposase